MKVSLMIGLISATALVAACSTQTTAPAAHAVALPAASGETVVASENIVPASSSTEAAKPESAKKADASKFSDSDIVCKRKIVTGSRFSKRICMSRGEWKRIQELGQKTADDFQKRGLRTNNPSGG